MITEPSALRDTGLKLVDENRIEDLCWLCKKTKKLLATIPNYTLVPQTLTKLSPKTHSYTSNSRHPPLQPTLVSSCWARNGNQNKSSVVRLIHFWASERDAATYCPEKEHKAKMSRPSPLTLKISEPSLLSSGVIYQSGSCHYTFSYLLWGLGRMYCPSFLTGRGVFRGSGIC